MSPQKINVCKVGLPHFSSTVHQVHCSFIADYLNATQMLKTALFVSLLSYPQSSLSLPCFTFWNCFSYHSRSATVHTCTFPDSRSDSRFYLRFYQVSPFPSLAGAFLPGPAWVCKSLIALQYSSHVKEQGMAEGEGGGRMDGWSESSEVCQSDEGCPHLSRTTAVKTSWTCYWNLWFTNISG